MSLHLRSREITRQNSSLVYSSTPFREHLMNKSRSTGDLDKSEREVLRSTLTGSSDHFQSTETVKSFDVSPQLVSAFLDRGGNFTDHSFRKPVRH